MRAVYLPSCCDFEFADTEVTARRTEEYLSRPEVRKLNEGQAILQASTFAYLEHFSGHKEAFAYHHEPAHRFAMWAHCGLVLERLSEDAHKILDILATERLSREEIAELWAEFWQTNKQIGHLARKFEPIEEIFATYIGVIGLPPEVRSIVEDEIKQDFEKRGWYTTYKAFVETCDNCQAFSPVGAAFFILDRVCLMLEKNDIDSVYLLEEFLDIAKIFWPYLIKSYIKLAKQKDDIDEFDIETHEKIDRILEQAGIPDEVFWSSIYEGIAELIHKLWGPENEFFDMSNPDDKELEIQKLLSYPLISLTGKLAEKTITYHISSTPFIPPASQTKDSAQIETMLTFPFLSEQEWKDNYYFFIRIFYESIRQQLSKRLLKRCGFVCPFASKYRQCCGVFNKELLWLYERLPEEDKKYFKRPNCALAR
jgi:hypothetical protein